MAEKENMAMVLAALKRAGLNDNQARILAAEIGRENAFQDRYLWGYHTDPKNKSKNIGIISWQGARADAVEEALQNAGLIKDGKIVRGQASLDVMAKYLVDEIRTDPSYKRTKSQFLDNPNVDYNTGSEVLGRNFIRWAYDNPKYSSGHENRDLFYEQLGGIAPKRAAPRTGVPYSPEVILSDAAKREAVPELLRYPHTTGEAGAGVGGQSILPMQNGMAALPDTEGRRAQISQRLGEVMQLFESSEPEESPFTAQELPQVPVAVAQPLAMVEQPLIPQNIYSQPTNLTYNAVLNSLKALGG